MSVVLGFAVLAVLSDDIAVIIVVVMKMSDLKNLSGPSRICFDVDLGDIWLDFVSILG